MKSFLGFLVICGLLVTVIIMGAGMVSLFRGENFSRKYGNFLMRGRVLAQGSTVVLLALWLFYDKLFM